MPRMREATRPGSKTSSASVFSPVPRNLIGTPVTVRMEMAAPPRASPSILVNTRPVKPIFLWKPSAIRTASWPVMASATSRVSTGCVRSRIATSSSISASSI